MNDQNEIIPAILPSSYSELEEKINIIAPHTQIVQIDICDGAYTPSKTWPYLKGPNTVDTIFEDIISQEKALPHWEEIDLEFDLMVKGAYEKIPDFISAGATRIIVHKKSVDEKELESIIRDYGKQAEDISIFGIELGLGFGNDATVEEIAPYIDRIHFIQIMGIDKIGFQGQSFNPRTINLVKDLRAAYPNLIISIDGGVNLETAAELVSAGANRLVVGSALFNTSNVLSTLEQFSGIISA